MMRRFVVAVGLGVGILLVAGHADAQYQYTNDKGVSKVTQYKLDVPAPYRDSAVWIGKTGIGKPASSEEQRRGKQREDAYRRIGEANAQLVPYSKAEAEAKKANAAAAQRAKKAEQRRDAAEAAQANRDRLAEESVRLQREAVDLERQRQWRGR
ncbi:MAG: hypothetical protein ACRDJ9_25230 [Dehalococcoidia bacterium]